MTNWDKLNEDSEEQDELDYLVICTLKCIVNSDKIAADLVLITELLDNPIVTYIGIEQVNSLFGEIFFAKDIRTNSRVIIKKFKVTNKNIRLLIAEIKSQQRIFIYCKIR
jgi:hypothetical protein